MNKLLLVALVLTTSFIKPLQAQTNLILNHSFENYVPPCPGGSPNGALGQVYDWHPANILSRWAATRASAHFVRNTSGLARFLHSLLKWSIRWRITGCGDLFAKILDS